jgi:hypothetical protein
MVLYPTKIKKLVFVRTTNDDKNIPSNPLLSPQPLQPLLNFINIHILPPSTFSSSASLVVLRWRPKIFLCACYNMMFRGRFCFVLGGGRGRGGFCGSWHGEAGRCNFEFAKDSIIGRFGYFQDRRPRRMKIFVEKVVLTASCLIWTGGI